MAAVTTITKKISGYEKPTIWYKFSKMALQTNSANLGQGFPDWKAPEFYYESLKRHITDENANHQYTRSFGNFKLVDSISRNYKDFFQRKIDPWNEVLISSGATAILYSAITALVEEGDEVVVMEPFYDCYLPQVKFSGGKVRGVPMIPPVIKGKGYHFKFDYELNENKYAYNPKLSLIKATDEWKIDFEVLAKTINNKTKLLILNTPNNPTGKILSDDELNEIKKIIDKYPNLYVIMDEVYEHQVFDNYLTLPRMATKNWERTISVMSAGKIFSATGIRIGWAIAPAPLIKQINSIHQYNSFCIFDPLQNTVADCLDQAKLPYKGLRNYYEWLRLHYSNRRNYLISAMNKTEYFKNSILFVPEGGYFVVVNISEENVEDKNYGFEEDNLTNSKDYKYHYTKDFRFLLNMCHDKKVVGIPLTPFFTEENRKIGENYVRLAFCKESNTINKAIEKLSI